MRTAIEERYGARAEVSEAFGETTVDIGTGDWIDLLTFARDDLGCVFFDWLTGVDDPPDGFTVVAHVFDPVEHTHLLLRTRVPREDPRLPTATGVFRGADWHERETFEMFGVIFEGHPHLVPLLLPDGFEGHPLRKDFILASRVAKPWPGAKEPGESGQGSPSRRKTLPPGVPTDWGPSATMPAPTRGPRAVRSPEPQAQTGESPPPPADPARPADPVRPVDPAKPKDPVKPADPVRPVDPVKPVDPTKPADPVKPVDPVKPLYPEEPVKPREPLKPVPPEDPVKPAEPLRPEEPLRPAEPLKPTEPLKPAEPMQPPGPSKPAEPSKRGEPVNPAEPVRPSEPVESAESPEPLPAVERPDVEEGGNG